MIDSNTERKLPILRQYMSYNQFFPIFISLDRITGKINMMKIASYKSLKTKAYKNDQLNSYLSKTLSSQFLDRSSSSEKVAC